MITGIGATGNRPLGQLRTEGAAPKAVATPTAPDAGDAAPVSTVSGLAAQGAPVDMDKVARIKAGIANGTYQTDPQAIAAKMIALDLPTK